MNIRTFFLLVMGAGIVVFMALNWSTITAPTVLSVGFASVEAPLGLVMLGLLVTVSVIFLAFIASLQTSVLLESRRHARDLQAQRELANQAEASRITELRAYIDDELLKFATRDAESRSAMLARIDKFDDTLRISLQDLNNTFAVYLGEFEERLAQGSSTSRPELPLSRKH